jgi:carboxypeptidase D
MTMTMTIKMWMKPASLALVFWTGMTAARHSGSSSHDLPRAKDYAVEGLEDVEPAFADLMAEGGYDMYAGLVPARDDLDPQDDASLFFWLFENDNATHQDALVVWFNGGPGCSSLDAGLLFEMGPVTTPLHRAGYDNSREGNTAPLQLNRYAWLHSSNIMYVEQPVGVGYSNPGKTGAPQNEDQVAADFYQFLRNFYRIFPHLQDQRLYLIGESYAGMYVPSMAHYIAYQNKLQESHQSKIPLAGIALGNGWVDAIRQGPMVIDYAWWHGMIDTVARDALSNVWEECVRHFRNDQHMPKPFHDFTVPDECGIMPQVLRAAGADPDGTHTPNTYDVTTWDKYAVLQSLETGENVPDIAKKV